MLTRLYFSNITLMMPTTMASMATMTTMAITMPNMMIMTKTSVLVNKLIGTVDLLKPRLDCNVELFLKKYYNVIKKIFPIFGNFLIYFKNCKNNILSNRWDIAFCEHLFLF